jgi:hypothetical protein
MLVGILVWILVAELTKYMVFWLSAISVTQDQVSGEVLKLILSFVAVAALLRGGRSWRTTAVIITGLRAILFGLASWEQLTWGPNTGSDIPYFGPIAGPVFAILSVGYCAALCLLVTSSVSAYLASRASTPSKGLQA